MWATNVINHSPSKRQWLNLKKSRPKLLKNHTETNRSPPHLLAEQPEPRDPPSTDITASEKICTVCSNIKQKGDRQKFRICEDVRVEKLLKAAVFFQDQVYYRTSDLEDVHSVCGSDLYCHRNCIHDYLIRYDRAKSECDAPSAPTKNRWFAGQVLWLCWSEGLLGKYANPRWVSDVLCTLLNCDRNGLGCTPVGDDDDDDNLWWWI